MRPSRRAGCGRKAHPKVREGTGGPARGLVGFGPFPDLRVSSRPLPALWMGLPILPDLWVDFPIPPGPPGWHTNHSQTSWWAS